MALPKLNIPTYELILPSTGKKIKYRPFLVKEHKVLLTMEKADTAEIARIIKELVHVCTFENLKIDNLPHFDIEYIFLQLRARSIGETVDVILNCDCGNKIDVSFNLDQVKVEKIPSHNNKIQLTDDYGVEMNYPSLEEVLDIFQSNDPDKVISLIIKNIKSVYSKDNYWETDDQSQDDIKEFVESLTKQQFELIEEFFVTSPKIVQTIEADCDQCGKHNISRLEGLANFFV